MVIMAGCETWNQIEVCRFCGMDLPAGSVDVIHHYNSHWRHLNAEQLTQNSCVFGENSDLQNFNSEDLEVSGHFDQNFQYSYSPQTEPSNLSLAGTRCSPLNLTGRAKVISPMSSPLVSSPMPDQHTITSSHLPTNSYHNQISNDDLRNYGIPQTYATFENISIPSCSGQEMPNFEDNVNLNSLPSCELNTMHDNSCKFDKKIKSCDKFDPKWQLPVKMLCNKIANLSCNDSIKSLNNEDAISPQILLNSKPLDVDQSIADSLPYNAPNKDYKCSICNKEFALKEELSAHVSSHDADKPYRCNLCGTGLSHISALKRHTLSHNGTKRHKCEVCRRSFYQKCDLQRHISIHRRKVLKCDICYRKFSYDYLLKNHRCKEPERPRPYKCNVCNVGCTTSVAWSYHMWKHTKNAAFVSCEQLSEAKYNELRDLSFRN